MSNARNKGDSPDPVDVHVGSKVRERRLLMGLSQDALAKSIGLTFQQVQKYERGTNRISVSRLLDICDALKVSVDYFLENPFAQNSNKKGGRKLAAGFSDNTQAALEYDEDPLSQKDVIELVRAYSQIKSPALKKQILEMAKAMSSNDKS